MRVDSNPVTAPTSERPTRRTGIAVGAGLATLTYASSLAVQRVVPSLRDALAIGFEGGVRPTYFLRVALSLGVGVVVAIGMGRAKMPERPLAIGLGIVIGVSVLLLCAFP